MIVVLSMMNKLEDSDLATAARIFDRYDVKNEGFLSEEVIRLHFAVAQKKELAELRKEEAAAAAAGGGASGGGGGQKRRTSYIHVFNAAESLPAGGVGAGVGANKSSSRRQSLPAMGLGGNSNTSSSGSGSGISNPLIDHHRPSQSGGSGSSGGVVVDVEDGRRSISLQKFTGKNSNNSNSNNSSGSSSSVPVVDGGDPESSSTTPYSAMK